MVENHDPTILDWWVIAKDWDPNAHMMQIERYDKRAQRKTLADYLTVPNRLMWYIRDQRRLIAAGLAKMPYIIQTDLIEMDRERGWAHYKTYIRDVLGNEAVMYGSESAGDFPDYAEKASTKSVGRALLLMGYGTLMAPELDEGERVVDSPVTTTRPTGEIHAQGAPRQPTVAAPTRPSQLPAPVQSPQTSAEPMATNRQMESIKKLCRALGRPEPESTTLTFAAARDLLTQLSHAYSESRTAAS